MRKTFIMCSAVLLAFASFAGAQEITPSLAEPNVGDEDFTLTAPAGGTGYAWTFEGDAIGGSKTYAVDNVLTIGAQGPKAHLEGPATYTDNTDTTQIASTSNYTITYTASGIDVDTGDSVYAYIYLDNGSGEPQATASGDGNWVFEATFSDASGNGAWPAINMAADSLNEVGIGPNWYSSYIDVYFWDGDGWAWMNISVPGSTSSAYSYVAPGAETKVKMTAVDGVVSFAYDVGAGWVTDLTGLFYNGLSSYTWIDAAPLTFELLHEGGGEPADEVLYPNLQSWWTSSSYNFTVTDVSMTGAGIIAVNPTIESTEEPTAVLGWGDQGEYGVTYDDGSKAPVSLTYELSLLPAGSVLPLTGLLGLGLLAGACALGGASVLRRKQ